MSTRAWNTPRGLPPWGGLHGIDTPMIGVDVSTWPAPAVYRVGVDPALIRPGTKLRVWPNPFGQRELIFTAVDAGVKGQAIVFFDQRGQRVELQQPDPTLGLYVERLIGRRR